MSQRTPLASVLCALLTLLLAACDAFDRGRLIAPVSGNGGMGGGGGGGTDAAVEDAGPCVPSAELCNGTDDDCDGVPDVMDMDARNACEPIVVHSDVRCASDGATVRCAKFGPCDLGFLSCDGNPANGCEHEGTECVECPTCEDAGDEDSGP